MHQVIPICVFGLGGLEVLNLEYNKIRYVGPELGNLRNMVDLNLSQNEIPKIPEELGYLPLLERLCLSSNRFRTLPESRRFSWWNRFITSSSSPHCSHTHTPHITHTISHIPRKSWQLHRHRRFRPTRYTSLGRATAIHCQPGKLETTEPAQHQARVLARLRLPELGFHDGSVHSR